MNELYKRLTALGVLGKALYSSWDKEALRSVDGMVEKKQKS